MKPKRVPTSLLRPLLRLVPLIAIAILLVLPSAAVAAEEEKDAAPGREQFMTHKCNLCHGVPAAGIESKTTSEKLKGPDLGGVAYELAEIGPWVRKEVEHDGKEHKREFKGSDEELQAILDWLLEQKAE